MKMNKTSRRTFLKQAAALSAAAIVPSFLTPVSAAEAGLPQSNRTAPRRISPGDKVNIAFVGIGNQGGSDSQALARTGLCNVVALCDVDMGARHTQRVIEMFPNVPRYQDYRKMFDEMADQIDAVLIATPDHSHFPITMHAMSLGKHVFTEKPLARTFQECELLMKAEKKYGVVTQMGNQGHSDPNYYQFKAWTEAGIIKDVTRITAHMNNERRWHGWDPNISHYPAAQAIPETLDWDTWLAGTHTPFDYNKDYHLGQWRCWYQFGVGVLGDWGAHIIDTAHEFLDLGLPTEVDPLYLKDHNAFFYPKSSTLLFKFPARGNKPACDITWYDGLDNIPAVPEGYGNVELDPNIPPAGGAQIQPSKLNPGKEIYSETLTFKGGSHGSTLSIIPEEAARDMASSLPEVPRPPSNHYENFLRAILGTEKATSPFSISGPLSQVFCLGVISQWSGKKVLFDRETKQITNDPRLNQLLWGPVTRQEYASYYL